MLTTGKYINLQTKCTFDMDQKSQGKMLTTSLKSIYE